MKFVKLAACILAVTAITSTNTFAQKCHFDVDKKDDFSGEHVRNVRVKVGTFFYAWWVLLEQKGPKYFITVQSATTGKVDNVIPKGSKVLFKLDNGKVVEMIVSDECVPAFSVQSNTIVTTWLPKGEVSKEIMKQLSESPTTMIRMNIGGKDFDSPGASGKEGRKMAESAACLLQD